MSSGACEPPPAGESEQTSARERALQCQTALLELAALEKSEFGTFLRRVLKRDAELLGLARVSFWRLEHEPALLRCEALYRRDTDTFEAGARMLEHDCPTYLKALQEELLVVAADARTDPRTREFTATYLEPLGIGSLMDVPVWVRGRLAGVVCHENVGGPREWTVREQEFALSVGHLVSMGLEAFERRKAEEALRQSEERFQVLMEQARDYSLVMLDSRGHIRAGAERLKGYRPEELEGRHLSIFFPVEAIELGRPEAALRRAAEHGRYEEEGWLVRSDGSRFWASLLLVPLWNETGGLRGFAGVTRDLTEERLAQERERLLREVQQSEEQQGLLARTSATLVSSLDYEQTLSNVAHLLVPLLADGCLIHLLEGGDQVQQVAALDVDPERQRLLEQMDASFPLSPQSPEGIGRVLRGEKPLFLPRLTDTLLAGLVSQPEKRELVRQLAPRSCISVPLRVRQRVLGALTVYLHRPGIRYSRRDLATVEELARRAAYAVENARLYRQAQEAVGVRDEFLSIASHELRTPLAALRLNLQGMQQLLQRGCGEALQEGARRKLESATRQTVRLGRLIDELLEVSRISAGRLGLQYEEVDLTELTHSMVEQLREEAARAQAPLLVHAEGPVRGRWDPLRLEQVLTNLLTNALKYGRGRRVDVCVEARGDLARLAVSDRGLGIDDKDRERIFGRFERAVSSRHFGGLGLGLYVTRQIVEAHHGVIHVESRPGEGSTFSVWLPRTPVQTHHLLPPETRGEPLH